MSAKRWSLYDPRTGIFLGRTISASLDDGHDGYLRAALPPGTAAIEGTFDHLSQRVDLTNGAVVDYQPRQPSADHEWDAGAKRWRIRADAAQRESRRAAAAARIEALELAQARPLRELMLNRANAAAHQRLLDIEAQIASLRSQING